MRSARPHLHPHHVPPRDRDCARLVVDAGGGLSGRKGGRSSDSASRDKHYSLDSGLSDDGSCGAPAAVPASAAGNRLRHDPPRDPYRYGGGREVRAVELARRGSTRSFRHACARALRDQQEQIARVAQLCERLTALTTGAAPRPNRTARRSPSPSLARSGPSYLSPDTTDSSTTRTRSTRDHRRKEKLRSEECKTYKLIMTKLDELNRMFAARARSPPAGGGGGRRRLAPSSGSVSVSDKLVATEPPPPRKFSSRWHRPMTTRLIERAVGESTLIRTPRTTPRAPPSSGGRTADAAVAPSRGALQNIAPRNTASQTARSVTQTDIAREVQTDLARSGEVQTDMPLAREVQIDLNRLAQTNLARLREGRTSVARSGGASGMVQMNSARLVEVQTNSARSGCASGVIQTNLARVELVHSGVVQTDRELTHRSVPPSPASLDKSKPSGAASSARSGRGRDLEFEIETDAPISPVYPSQYSTLYAHGAGGRRRRAHSVEPAATRRRPLRDKPPRPGDQPPRSRSLCGLCRGYFRALANCIKGQMFWGPA